MCLFKNNSKFVVEVLPCDDVRHGDGVDDVEASNNVRHRPETSTANEWEHCDGVPSDDSWTAEPGNKYR